MNVPVDQFAVAGPWTPSVIPKYGWGVTMKKRTFSLPDEVSEQLDAAAAGNASAYVADAVRDKIARDRAKASVRAAYGPPDLDAYTYWVEKFTAGRPALP